MADIEGALSALDGADIADLDGEIVRDGALAVDDPLDAPALAGWVASWGDAGATEAADDPALLGWVASWGDLEATEAANNFDIDGELAEIVAAEPASYTRYTCRLIGTPDLVLPISGFSTRLRTGTPSYLSVTVPDATEYAEEILERQDGDIVVTRTIYGAGDAVLSTEDIATANFYGVRTDRTASSFAAVLTGYKQRTTTAYNIVYLDGLAYRADTYDADGALTGITVRTRPHNALLPGHTARVRDTDGGWLDIVADMIAYSVSGQGETFEVTGVPAA